MMLDLTARLAGVGNRARAALKRGGLKELIRKLIGRVIHAPFAVRDLVVEHYLGAVALPEEPFEYHGTLIPLKHEVLSRKIRGRFLRGTYEKEEFCALEKYWSGSTDLVDLGASTGFLSVYAAQRIADERKVISIEADPRLVEFIRQVAALNGVALDVISAAYAPGQEEVRFYQHPMSVAGSVQRRTNRSVTVPAVDLERLSRLHDLQHPVVVSDMEGGEIALIGDELSLLEEVCPLAIIEYHTFVDGTVAAQQAIAESNFRLLETFGSVHVYVNPSVMGSVECFPSGRTE